MFISLIILNFTRLILYFLDFVYIFKKFIMEKHLITKEQLENFKNKLKNLKEVERPQVIERVKIAVSFGDLSENAEYNDAKESQGLLEGKIIELEKIIKNTKIIFKKDDINYARIGKVVVLKKIDSQESSKREEYQIVGVGESDPINGKISYKSPLGNLLFKKKKGDFVKINSLKGKIEYQIIDIK